MSSYFSKYENNLLETLKNTETNSYEGYSYFIKGDISGIQEFIFNVQSEGAAKTLKARSFFIQALSRVCVEHFYDKLGHEQCSRFYDGGGTFYMFSKQDAKDAITEIQAIINEYCAGEEFYVVLNQIKLDDDYLINFGKAWFEINQASNEEKLKKFFGYSKAFEPYDTVFDTEGQTRDRQWKSFTTQLVDREDKDKKGLILADLPNARKLVVKKESIGILCKKLSIGNQAKKEDNFKGSIINKLPVWTDKTSKKYADEIHIQNKQKQEDEENSLIRQGQIIDFHMMGIIAKQRTGTDKLGVLKLDIDELGTLFRGLESLDDLQRTSQAMEWFFNRFLYNLWSDGKFEYQKIDENKTHKISTEAYKDNIYVVFAGGDDCFVVGGWDAVFKFAGDLHRSFEEFEKTLRNTVGALKENVDQLPNKKITLSASLTIVGSKFPVVRFANMAEEALENAKKQIDKATGEQVKNSISVFGHVMPWEDFYKADDTAQSLQHMVTEGGESRALLERLQQSAPGFARLFNRAEGGNLRSPQVSRLYYYLRNVKNRKNLEILEHQIIKPYSMALLRAYQEAKNPNYDFKKTDSAHAWVTIPVAARWAELLTRKK